MNNYTATALSNTVSKTLECIPFKYIKSDVDVDWLQFGFQKQHATADCTRVLKRTVNYCRQRCSWQYGSSFSQFDTVGSLSYCVKSRVMTASGSFKVTQGHRFWYRSKARMRLLLVNNMSYLAPLNSQLSSSVGQSYSLPNA